jgi:hypothetical protein
MKYESILLIKFSLTRVPEHGERSKGSNAQLTYRFARKHGVSVYF